MTSLPTVVARSVSAAAATTTVTTTITVHALLLGTSAILASNRLVGKSFRVKELLLFGRKDKFSFAIATLQVLVGKIPGWRFRIVFAGTTLLVAAIGNGGLVDDGRSFGRVGFRVAHGGKECCTVVFLYGKGATTEKMRSGANRNEIWLVRG
jgi:hypothetical protein